MLQPNIEDPPRRRSFLTSSLSAIVTTIVAWLTVARCVPGRCPKVAFPVVCILSSLRELLFPSFPSVDVFTDPSTKFLD